MSRNTAPRRTAKPEMVKGLGSRSRATAIRQCVPHLTSSPLEKLLMRYQSLNRQFKSLAARKQTSRVILLLRKLAVSSRLLEADVLKFLDRETA